MSDNNIRYTNFELVVNESQYLALSVSLIESMFGEFFKEYKYQFASNGLSVKAYGVAKIRKRLSTFASDIQLYFKDHEIDQMQIHYVELVGLRGKFDRYKFDDNEREEILDVSQYQDRIDIEQLSYRAKRYSWQNEMYDSLYDDKKLEFIKADDRSIIWVYDKHGNTGKSKFVKWFCINHSKDVCKLTFGTASQLRNAMVNIGAKKVYFMDIPRTTGSDDALNSLITLLEDVKNGFVTGVMYGRYRSYMMAPPHVVIFSNMKCPSDMMSEDRWIVKEIDRRTKSFR